MIVEQDLSGKHLIGGEWVVSEGERVAAVNPATGEELTPAFHQATEAEVDRAMRAAAEAFDATRQRPAETWADLLETITEKIMALGDRLLETAGAETALPRARLESERGRTCNQLRMFAELVREGSWVDAVIDTRDPERKPIPKPDIRRMLRPLGPVVVFDASNFPFAFGPCGGDTASAFAAGNPVVVKAHPGHPATDELFAGAALEALQDAGLPPGLFGLLQGASPETSQALVAHPLAEAVGFTGSQRAGRALFDVAAARPRPIPVYAEMGSVNPLVVLPGALAERPDAVADGLAQSVTMGVGQFCTKPGLVFLVDGPGADAFQSRLTQKMGEAAAGPMLNARIRDGFCRSMAQATVAGASTLIHGECTGHADAAPSLMAVDSATWRARPDLREEVFGPASLLVCCRDEEDLLKALTALEGQLTGSVHTGAGDSPETVRRVASALDRRVGRVIFNGYPTGVEVCHAMVHGGPYPATTAPGSTSVGTLAIRRFVRPVAWQDAPWDLLAPELRDENPRRIWRKVNGNITRQPIMPANP